MEKLKLVFLVYEEGIQPDVMELLGKLGIEHYTAWEGAQGSGRTGPKHGDPIWPGLNNMLMMVLPEEQVGPLTKAALKLRDSFPVTPGMRFMVTDVTFI